MRYRIIALLLVFSWGIALGQQKGPWCKTFAGKMGNMNAVVHLANGPTFNGYIWFQQNQYPIQLIGNFTKGDSITLSGMDAALDISLSGTLKNGSLEGVAEIKLEQGDGTSRKGSFQLHTDSTYTPFKYIYVKTEAHLPAKLKNQSTFDYYKATVWPSGKNELAGHLQSTIRNFAGIPKDREPSQWYFSDAEKAKTGWQRENNKLSPQDAETLGLSLSVEEQEIINVMYENDRYISFAKYSFSYTGGAHGNYATQCITVSKSSGQPLKITDVLTPEGLKQMPKIIEQVARVRYKVPSGKLEDNGFLVNSIPLSKEFYVTSAGIGFLYAPYEIKSFADGEINLVVPFRAIQQYLNPKFKP